MDKTVATFRQSITSFFPGILTGVLIAGVCFSALVSLWLFTFERGNDDFYFDQYWWRILSFTFIQAGLSVVISIVLAIFLAKSIYQHHFIGKRWLLRILSLTFVLPSLVVVTGLLNIYGRSGWISQLCALFNINVEFSIYGLQGILIAHVFLNFPFATQFCYQALSLIPNEQKQLAQSLGLTYWQTFYYLELPIIKKQLLPLSGLIFMLCFSSFATVLALSGGPKYTTIEVAIYQALRDFELYQAAVLSLIQLIFCVGVMLFLKKFESKTSPYLIHYGQSYIVKTTWWQTLIGFTIIILCSLFIIAPLFSIVLEGLFHFSIKYMTYSLFLSLSTSVVIAISSALLSMGLAILLLWTHSRLKLAGYHKIGEGLMLLGTSMLAIPSMVLSAGFFILFYDQADNPNFILILMVISNSFLALPFILKQLANPLLDLTKQYHLLSQSLNIHGVSYFYLIEFKALKKLFIYSFSFACIISMGDFGIIALFGNQDFSTLPYYLYDLISHYRYDEASFIALLLLFISFLFITLFEYMNDDPA